MDPSDEELIRKFAELQTQASTHSNAVTIPAEATITKDWNLCLTIKVCSDKMVFQSQFEKFMRSLWDVKPSTVFTSKDRGIFLVEFSSPEEVQRVKDEGPWFYRDDLVAVAPCKAQANWGSEINAVEMWVQFHNVQLDSLTKEGIRLITDKVGPPVSDPVGGSINSKYFFKVKLQVPINQP